MRRVKDPANGLTPEQATASTMPNENTSLAGPSSPPSACSGDAYPDAPRARQLAAPALGVGGAGDPEIDQPRPVLGQQDLRGLEVPVHRARRVDARQRGR
nr:hypothetical protein [Prauserella flavalba]